MKSIRKNFILTCSLSLIAVASFAQTGPGGVDNSTNVSMWLKADDLNLSNGASISNWPDASGNGNNATQSISAQRPSFVSSSPINGQPAVLFDGGTSNSTSDFMRVTDDDKLDNSNGLTFYSIIRSPNFNSPAVQAIFGKRIAHSTPDEYAYTWFQYSGRQNFLDINTQNNRISSGVTFSDNTNYLTSASFDGTLSSSSRSKIYRNGTLVITGNESSSSVINGNTDLFIGVMNENYGQYFNGYMSELIIFHKALNEAERVIVDNYLGAKYDISIANSHYSYEDTHGYQLVGIGQASDGSNHTSSTGDGILTLSNASGLGNSEFLFIGHDNGNMDLTVTCDAPSTYGQRLERTWKVGETGDVGTVSLSFDLSGVGGLGAETDLVLIQSTTSDLSNATIHTTGRNLSGTTLSFTNVDLNDGVLFTIAQLGNTKYYDGTTWVGGAPSNSDADNKLLVMSGTATMSSNASCECVFIESGASLNLTNSASLEIDNGIINRGTVNVASAASIVQNGTATNSGTGNYIIQRNSGVIADDTRYQYWSSPISNATMGSTFVGANTSDFYYFDEGTTNNWASQPSGSTMTPARGYITTSTIDLSNSSETRMFDGTINNGIVQLSTSNVSSGEFILAGNPYPSAINSTDFVAGNAGISGTLWFWNHSTAQVGGANDAADYATWTGMGSTGGNTAKAPDDYIQSAQGFFVEASSSNPSISFTNNMRVVGNNTQFFKTQQNEERNRVWLSITNTNNDYNQILIGFAKDATDGVDRLYDGKKFKAHPRISFYSLIDSVDYSIQGLPNPVYLIEKKIPLGLDAWTTGSHSITIDSLDNWPTDYALTLIDHYLDSIHDLRINPIYTFDIEQVGAIKNRFELGVKDVEEDISTGLESANQNVLKTFISNDQLIVQSQDVNIQNIFIYDINGRILHQSSNLGTRLEQITLNTTGTLIISVILENQESHKQLIFSK